MPPPPEPDGLLVHGTDPKLTRHVAPPAATLHPPESRPRGCASGECLLVPAEEAKASPAPTGLPVQSPSTRAAPKDAASLWRSAVAELKAQKRDLLAGALANGRLLGMEKGQLRVGYSPREGLYRRQAERMKGEAETILSRLAGSPMGLVLDTVDEVAATPSIAQEETERVRARDERIRRDSRENAAVLAAMRLLEGTVEQIRVTDDEDSVPGFTQVPDGDEAGPEDG